jgi:type II secretory pathway pseudopilin PulG
MTSRSPRGGSDATGRRRRGRGGFTLIEMLTVVAALIILLGLMVSLAWDVRRQSSERLTKELLVKLDALMSQYVAEHKRLPQVTLLVGRAAETEPATQPGMHPPRAAEEELPDEEALLAAAELNNRDFVLALRSEAAGQPAGRSPELFGPLSGPMYDEVTLRDAWGTPIVFMPAMHPAIGMALGNRPFFLSAGPDRKYRTLEDNLYSYEQGAPEVTE